MRGVFCTKRDLIYNLISNDLLYVSSVSDSEQYFLKGRAASEHTLGERNGKEGRTIIYYKDYLT